MKFHARIKGAPGVTSRVTITLKSHILSNNFKFLVVTLADTLSAISNRFALSFSAGYGH